MAGGDYIRDPNGTEMDTIIDASASMFDSANQVVDIAFERKKNFENSPTIKAPQNHPLPSIQTTKSQ